MEVEGRKEDKLREVQEEEEEKRRRKKMNTFAVYLRGSIVRGGEGGNQHFANNTRQNPASQNHAKSWDGTRKFFKRLKF